MTWASRRTLAQLGSPLLCVLLGLLSLAPLGCRKSSTEPTVSEPRGTSLLLQVVDMQGHPVPGAVISSRSERLSVDSSGHRLFENLPPGRFVARVDALGFASATSVVELQAGARVGTQVRLLPRPAPLSFQARQGGSLQTAQVRFSLPPDAVVDSMGRPVTGSVDVTLAPWDPSLPQPSAPGPLEGLSAITGEAAQLESLFMAEVSLWSGGAPVQLAPGKSATLEFLLPQAVASQFKEGDTVPAWWFDLDAGLWREEGAGIVLASRTWPGRMAWTAVVSHLTSWAALVPWNLTGISCVNVRVVDPSGMPVPNVAVTARGVSYTWVHATQYTGPNGQICEGIKRGYFTSILVGSPEAPLSSTQVAGQLKASCGSGPCEEVTLTMPPRVCNAGAYESCPYSGPSGTEGVGRCQAGRKWCNLMGTAWLSCQGEVLPTAEDCQTPFDDDCDGVVNEDCFCPGQGAPCYGGPPATAGVGLCQQGTVGCDSFGTPLCLGQQLPQAERCWTPEDEDCDGVGACTFGDWSPTGSLITARSGHTATLLADGRVLVVGGWAGIRGPLALAEVYDPASGTWSVTGSLSVARSSHTATLLPNGKVLVAGGYNNGGNLAAAEVYDPASGTWSATGSLASVRAYHTAALLPNGKVLVVGGNGTSGVLATAEVYDPASGTWSATGSLGTARYWHTATLLADGRVLVAGGVDARTFFATAEVYQSALGTWSATGPLAAVRAYHTATLLPDGKVLVAGGAGSSGVVATAEVYDPASGTWSVTGSLGTARYYHTASLLPDGGVLAAGGSSGPLSGLDTAEVYRPASGTWGVTGSLSSRHSGHTATVLRDGKVLVTGGTDGGTLQPLTELY